MSRRSADLPLHGGSAPSWLFRRMVDLAGAIGVLIVRDQGPAELLRRLSDPFWFQAFGCVLGFDWHSSGVTTTVCGALKEAAKKMGSDLGLVVCGGKGKTSRKTPDDIRRACDKFGDDADRLIRASKLVAKVDSAAVQDGYQLYHHAFFFVPGSGKWSVVQQGMNETTRYARRYHWLSETMPSFVSEPHAAVACDTKSDTLNLVAGETDAHRDALTRLSRETPERVLREIRVALVDEPMPLFEAVRPRALRAAPALVMPSRHSLSVSDLNPASVKKVLLATYEKQATSFEGLLGATGVGPMALRSLSLIAELIYNAPASRRDPAAYSFAHGGKDGHPYFVNRPVYDASVERLREAINRAKVGHSDKVESLRALAKFTSRLAKA
ncbi:MAG: DUF763 domain-containing protein [Gemmataceae bacterium]